MRGTELKQLIGYNSIDMPFCPLHKTYFEDPHRCRECAHDTYKAIKDGERIELKRKHTIQKAKEKASIPKPAVKKVSTKHKADIQAYGERVKVWKLENPKCKANCNEYCTKETDDCQHLRGRGKYLMDESTWLPVCRSCHTYIGDHSKEAYEKGWALSRLENVQQEPHII